MFQMFFIYLSLKIDPYYFFKKTTGTFKTNNYIAEKKNDVDAKHTRN